VTELGFIQPAYKVLWCLFQTEIAKRLNAIIAQILPFLSQEVSECAWLPNYRHKIIFHHSNIHRTFMQNLTVNAWYLISKHEECRNVSIISK